MGQSIDTPLSCNLVALIRALVSFSSRQLYRQMAGLGQLSGVEAVEASKVVFGSQCVELSVDQLCTFCMVYPYLIVLIYICMHIQTNNVILVNKQQKNIGGIWHIFILKITCIILGQV